MWLSLGCHRLASAWQLWLSAGASDVRDARPSRACEAWRGRDAVADSRYAGSARDPDLARMRSAHGTM